MKEKFKPTCEQIIDILPGPFLVIDRQYHIVSTNEAYRQHYRVGKQDLVGRRCHEISHHSSVPCSQNGEHCPLEVVLSTGKSAHVVHEHYSCQGGAERVHLQAVPIFDEVGQIRYIGEYVQVPMVENADKAILIGKSRSLLHTLSLLQRVAPTETTVLIQGESGVGKERVAEYIHHYSRRTDMPFVVVDCSTLGETVIESELFGHEKGAFTGAAQMKKGLFEIATGGSLFIDEVGELPLHLQSKLLRVLETGKIRRLGGTKYIAIDARIIVATHRNLRAMANEGSFRHDLYYRLSPFPVEVPPLRDRKDDVAALAEYGLSRVPDGERHIPLSAQVIERLLGYDYPGNVRELNNVMCRAAILAGDDIIGPEHIHFTQEGVVDNREQARISLGQEPDGVATRVATQASPRPRFHPSRGVPDATVIEQALVDSGGHRGRAAAMLGVTERTLYRYLVTLKMS